MGGQEESDTDHCADPQAHFSFHFLFAICIMFSPRMHQQDTMAPLCSLFLPPLLFPSRVFLLTWRGEHGSFVSHLAASMVQLCWPPGCHLTHKRCKSSPCPRPFAHRLRCRHSCLGKAPEGRVDHSCFHLLVTFTYVPKPPIITGTWVISLTSLVIKLAKADINWCKSSPCLI